MIVFIVGLLITIYFFQRYFFGKSILDRIKEESIKTHKTYHQYIPELLPWTSHDIPLLSYHLHQKSERKGFGHTIQGIFTTIYQENMFIFLHKKPITQSEHFTIVITPEHEIWYDPKNLVYVNGEYLGKIDDHNRFVNKKLRRTFGSVKEKRNHLFEILNEQNIALAGIKSPEDWDLPFPRAVEIYKDLLPEELIIFKVLGCKKIIDIYLSRTNLPDS